MFNNDAVRLIEAAASELGWCDESKRQAMNWTKAASDVDGLFADSSHALEAVIIMQMHSNGHQLPDFYRERHKKVEKAMAAIVDAAR